jgi:hypothetical protein
VRVWDVSPGYLNRGSLLGEHRELHGLHAILGDGKTGYARHPETRRWIGALSGLACRHAQLAAEMHLRGYRDRTPLPFTAGGDVAWPATFIDPPGEQYAILGRKYIDKAPGRIPLPRNAQELWAQHKYSVMASDPAAYRTIGRGVARMRGDAAMSQLAADLVCALRQPPSDRRLFNALEHMWGYVRGYAGRDEQRTAATSPAARLETIQALALRHREPYLLASTALSELTLYVRPLLL